MRKPFENEWPITQLFGENPKNYAQFGLKGHNGTDYGLPTDTEILAPFSGKIIEVGWDKSGYGLYMKIENDKEGCILAHLKDNLLAIGADCSEGQLIAHSDNTGNSTGPHLHFGYYLKPRDTSNGYAGYIDPEPYLNPPQTDTPADQCKSYKDELEQKNKIIMENNKLIDSLKNDLKKESEEINKITSQASIDLENANKKFEEANKKIDLLNEKISQLEKNPTTPVVIDNSLLTNFTYWKDKIILFLHKIFVIQKGDLQ